MELGLAGKVVLVAGSSRGIGLAIARAFATEGAEVILSGRDIDRLERARAEIGDGARAVCADMTVTPEIERALEYAGDLDVLVANVGSGRGRTGPDLGPTDWEAAVGTNLVGSMLLTARALPGLRRRRGNVVFISSIAGREALPAPVPYAAAKAALEAAAKSYARLIAADGIRVNVVAPGNVLFPGGSWEQRLEARRDETEDYVRREVPLGRFGRPEEIADAVLFLASERASFITGTCLVVDGGQTRAFH